MIDPTEDVVTTDDATGDVNLDTDVVRFKDGRRLTNAFAEQLAEDALAEARRRTLVRSRESASRPAGASLKKA